MLKLNEDREVKNWLIPFNQVDQLPKDITEDKY